VDAVCAGIGVDVACVAIVVRVGCWNFCACTGMDISARGGMLCGVRGSVGVGCAMVAMWIMVVLFSSCS
jgi:hypothetical protein